MEENAELQKIISEIDYDELNSKIASHLSSYKVARGLSNKTDKLAKLVYFSRPKGIKRENHTLEVSISESFDYVLKFFEHLDSNLAYRFQNIMQEKYTGGGDHGEDVYTVHLETSSEKLNKRGVSYSDGFVDIAVAGDIHDAFTIMHEMVHKFTQPYRQFGVLRNILGEVPTLSLEFMMYDYFISTEEINRGDEIFLEECRKFIKNRCVETILVSLVVLVEKELFDLYRDNGNRISEEILTEYLTSPTVSVAKKKIFSYYLKKNFPNFQLSAGRKVRYTIGFLLACYFRCKFREDPSVLGTLFELNNLLAHTDDTLFQDIQTLKDLGIPLFANLPDGLENMPLEEFRDSGALLAIDEETLELLKRSYVDVLEEFFGEQVRKDKDENKKRSR